MDMNSGGMTEKLVIFSIDIVEHWSPMRTKRWESACNHHIEKYCSSCICCDSISKVVSLSTILLLLFNFSVPALSLRSIVLIWIKTYLYAIYHIVTSFDSLFFLSLSIAFASFKADVDTFLMWTVLSMLCFYVHQYLQQYN